MYRYETASQNFWDQIYSLDKNTDESLTDKKNLFDSSY